MSLTTFPKYTFKTHSRSWVKTLNNYLQNTSNFSPSFSLKTCKCDLKTLTFNKSVIYKTKALKVKNNISTLSQCAVTVKKHYSHKSKKLFGMPPELNHLTSVCYGEPYAMTLSARRL